MQSFGELTPGYISSNLMTLISYNSTSGQCKDILQKFKILTPELAQQRQQGVYLHKIHKNAYIKRLSVKNFCNLVRQLNLNFQLSMKLK